ncbi:MAG: glycosyltransferase [Actinocatenispora sp.]
MAQSKARSKLRRIRHRLKVITQFESHAYWRSQKIRPNTVLYEAFSGNGMLCNPEAIFRSLLDAPDQQHLQHIWALSDLERYQATVAEFADRPNVTFVKFQSRAYYRALATSQYLINNATFPPQFGKRDGQTYINTWHGTPLKKMGYDSPGGGPEARNILRNFVSADYLLSNSEFMTKQMYETAYKLRGIYRGSIIQEGYPRIDRQYQSADEARQVRASLRESGVEVDDAQKIILYAPTWKGSSFHTPENDMEELRTRIRELTERIDGTQWRVLLRVHQQVYKFAMHDRELRGMLIPNDIPANVALGVADVLLTDYSSIFYDFLATGRPILFYVPDLALYSDYRGLYVTPDEWPGPVTDSISTLAEQINHLGTGDDKDVVPAFAARYEKCAAEYCPSDDGKASERVVDVVFRGKTEGYDVRTDLREGRQSILVYLGGMRTNGITTSALNLLDNIDFNRFDVSALYSYRRRSKDRIKNEEAINPRIRLFPYVGGINGSKRFTMGRRALLAKGLDAPRIDLEAHRRLFREEWVRTFGMTEFDYVVDFSGYGPFWTYVFLEGKARKHSIWMHNDMAADRMREVGGRRHLERGLGAVFSAYRHYDNLVSVSPALAEINKSKLGDSVGDAQFTSALNTINFERILRMADEELLEDAAEEEYEGGELGSDEDVVPDNGSDSPGPEPLTAAEEARRAEIRAHEAEHRAMMQKLVRPAPDVTTFLTVGRLSPEKNHDRLIRAFQLVHQENPKTRLIIISNGPLRDDLDRLIAELGLQDAIIMAGQQNNPYAIMKRADCFVMSSDYEGQPMVILEARVLGLPVVSTDFASVGGSLPEGVGLVVSRSVDALADGMREMLAGRVPNPPFDYAAYNQDAVEQFYRAIGAAEHEPATTGAAGAGSGQDD